jgi:hypothetical protein
MSRAVGSANFAKVLPRDAHHRLQRETNALKSDLMAEGLIEPRPLTSIIGGSVTSPRVTDGERAAIAAFLATKQPRRFADHDSGDDFNLCVFLKGKGHKVQRNCSIGSRRAPFFIDEKAYSRTGFIAFVNRVRASLSLQPIGLPA